MDSELKKYLGQKVRKHLAEKQITTKDLRDRTKHSFPISKWLIDDLIFTVTKERSWKPNKQMAIIQFLKEQDNVIFDGHNYKLKKDDSGKSTN